MAKMTVQRVGVLSLAKTQCIVGLGVGLIIGVVYGLLLMVMGAAMMASRQSVGSINAGGFLGVVLLVIGIPIAYGVIGFIGGALVAMIYNLAANFTGGIELELDAESAFGVPPLQPPYGNPG